MNNFKKSLTNKIHGILEMLRFRNAFVLILDRVLFPNSKLTVYRLGNLEIPVDRAGGDLQSIRYCLAGPMYRQLLSGLRFEDPLNVLDLGAHVGGFSLLIADMGFRIKRVVAVELNPNTALRLLYNLKINLHDRAKVSVLNAGVSGNSGTFRGAFSWGSSSESLYIPGAIPKEGSSEVPLRTVDDIINTEFKSEVIDLCKIDIEGAEYGVFENKADSLKRVRYILIEIHQNLSKGSGFIVSSLNQLGFQVLQENQEEHVFLLKNSNLF